MARSTRNKADGRPQTVCIVEDNSDEAFMMQRAAAQAAIAVDTVVLASGEAAVEFLCRGDLDGRCSDLVLLDLKLPGGGLA